MLERVESQLAAQSLEADWDACLGSWEGADPAEVEDVRGWVQGLRDEFVSLARKLDDSEEIELAAALYYIELKSHWVMLNTRIQYELFRRGEVDDATTYRASVVSMLVVALEELLEPDDIRRIGEFLAEPLGDG